MPRGSPDEQANLGDRGPGGQPAHPAPPTQERRLRGHRGGDRRGRRSAGRAGAPRSHPDGHPAAGTRWIRGHPPDQGQSGPQADPDHRGHVVRPERRRREGLRGRLRCLRHQAVQPSAAVGQGPGAPEVNEPSRILIVDDTPANLHILQLRLAASGYEILTASDGEGAIAAARQHHPDLILLDVMMPKMDGIEVCRQLRADSSLPFIPIIMVTAKADSRDVVAGLEAGGDEYLIKPVDQAALVARVKSMLRIKKLHDTGQQLTAELEEWNKTLG